MSILSKIVCNEGDAVQLSAHYITLLDFLRIYLNVLSIFRDNESKIFPFYPGRFHDFDEENVSHFYTAFSQFYKMALNRSLTRKTFIKTIPRHSVHRVHRE